MHRRQAPRRHYFRYRVWWLLIDIDELPALSRRLRLFSHNRFNVFAFHDSDYAPGTTGLRAHIEDRLGRAGIDLGGGPIRFGNRSKSATGLSVIWSE